MQSLTKKALRRLMASPRWVRLVLGFVLGFSWDLLTLRRIDDLGDNVGVMGGLLLLGVFLALSLRRSAKRGLGPFMIHSVWLSGAVIAVYQVFALVVGHAPLSWLRWASVLCRDGCWLPSLGANGFWDHAECVLALGAGLGLVHLGTRLVRAEHIGEDLQHGFALIRQFLWGNVLAAYLIFYFRSADLGPALLYVALIGGLIGANEFLPKRDRTGLIELASFLFSAFSFFLYAGPVAVAYWPARAPELVAVRRALLMPGTWAPFLVAVGAAVLLTTVVGIAGSVGPKQYVDPRPRKLRTRHALQRIVVHSTVWAVLIMALGCLRVIEAIPPAPLGLNSVNLVAKAVDRSSDCSGPVVPKAGTFMIDRFRFEPNKQTRIVLDASVFAPRHITIPVTFRWEYFRPPGESGAWWNPDAWWHDTTDGRVSPVRGWDERGFSIQSCKRVFTGAHGPGLRALWRITFSTPGDRDGQANEGLLQTREYKVGRKYFWLSEGRRPSW